MTGPHLTSTARTTHVTTEIIQMLLLDQHKIIFDHKQEQELTNDS